VGRRSRIPGIAQYSPTSKTPTEYDPMTGPWGQNMENSPWLQGPVAPTPPPNLSLGFRGRFQSGSPFGPRYSVIDALRDRAKYAQAQQNYEDKLPQFQPPPNKALPLPPAPNVAVPSTPPPNMRT
jgi:hypothetical protein